MLEHQDRRHRVKRAVECGRLEIVDLHRSAQPGCLAEPGLERGQELRVDVGAGQAVERERIDVGVV